MKKVFTTGQVAKICQVAARTVGKWFDTGKLRGYRIPGSQELLAVGAERNPMGRMTTPRDVAGAIYLLCLEEASWINGSLLHVDGGEHCR